MLATGLAVPAQAQDVQRIAAVVNDDVISIYDIRQRAELLIFSAGLPNTAETRQRIVPQVLRGLIDERLQMQEAERQNVRVTQPELEGAVSRIERANNLPAGGFERYLESNGISREAAIDQVRAALTWQKLLAQRVVPTIEIGEEEIDAVVARIESSVGQTEFHVAEILLPVDNPADRAQIQELANRLTQQLRGGAEFPAVAQQFSKSASAATGGDIGWIQQGELGGTLDSVLSGLDVGAVSAPVETPDGLLILKLLEKRRNTGGAGGQTVKLRQLLLPIEGGASEAEVDAQMQRARQVTSSASGCAAFAEAASALGTPQPEEPAEFMLADLNEDLRPLAAELPVGQASEPMRGPAGVQVLMICERQNGGGPDRAQIRDTLLRDRLDMLSRRYLRDLRRAAFVDVRV